MSAPADSAGAEAVREDREDGARAPALPAVDVLVCVTCRHAEQTDPNAPREGARLYEELAARTTPEGVRVHAVECLSNCNRGCSVALRGDGRWTYVYGNLDARSGADLVIDGATRYHAARDGLVPWRERSDHFRKNCIARIPPLEAKDG